MSNLPVTMVGELLNIVKIKQALGINVCKNAIFVNSPNSTKRYRTHFLASSASLYSTSSAYSTTRLTPLKILGLSPNSSKAEIKKKYYELCKLHHPDRVSPNNIESRNKYSAHGSDEKFKQIQWAYEQLVKNKAAHIDVNKDFSNYDYYNRAAFYYQERRMYDSDYYSDAAGAHPHSGSASGTADQYGFYRSNSHPAAPNPRDNNVLGGILFGVFALSGIGFIAYYAAVLANVSESAGRSHLEAVSMLKRVHLKARGVVSPKLLDMEDSNYVYVNAGFVPATSTDEYPEDTLHHPSQNAEKNHLESCSGAYYLLPNKDEQIMRFISTYDSEIGGERRPFPYGRFSQDYFKPPKSQH
ncbi:hypothetical protein AYI70_g37 [Smittium culicis]|uniref:J domain-containing protein n=1 Tax=Smittium culicis TaxID=133412 RepID=A0A1R1YI76_9FUNG|nr:hypothetical protein AYI70_g37 [Smittium culicis]